MTGRFLIKPSVPPSQPEIVFFGSCPALRNSSDFLMLEAVMAFCYYIFAWRSFLLSGLLLSAALALAMRCMAQLLESMAHAFRRISRACIPLHETFASKDVESPSWKKLWFPSTVLPSRPITNLLSPTAVPLMLGLPAIRSLDS